MTVIVNALGLTVFDFIASAGKMVLFFIETIYTLFTTPFKVKNFFRQMEFIGVNSLFVVVLTGLFAGMVLALESYYAFKMFRAESLIGVTVTLSMFRELGPVLGSLMVTARAGSAIAAELGTMRVTEQIDAMDVMGVNPVGYLIVPRVMAGIIVMPILIIIVDIIGVIGGYFVGVILLGVNEGLFWQKIFDFVKCGDLYNGLIKSLFFGFILTFVACFTGYYAEKGAKGVGRATTHSVVISSVMILISDYILTALLF